MKARYVSAGHRVDYTPTVDVAAGDVIVIGSLIGVASCDILANRLGVLATEGVFDIEKKNEQQNAGIQVYWDADGNPYGGTAGSGCLSLTSADGPLFGVVLVAAVATAKTVRVKKV